MPSTPPGAVDVIGQHWPTIGPHTDETVSSAALAVSELCRYLAHATRAGKALPYACDGYTVVGRLATAATAARQVLTQLSDWAADLPQSPGLRHDAGENATDTAVAAAAHLLAATGALDRASSSLARAHSALGHLYHEQDGE